MSNSNQIPLFGMGVVIEGHRVQPFAGSRKASKTTSLLRLGGLRAHWQTMGYERSHLGLAHLVKVLNRMYE